MHPEEQTFFGRTLSEGLARCPPWRLVPEWGTGQFVI
jgi:hypothetical protein